eukprot:scaffold625_cov324-Pavlova_lutheri.AAC.117
MPSFRDSYPSRNLKGVTTPTARCDRYFPIGSKEHFSEVAWVEGLLGTFALRYPMPGIKVAQKAARGGSRNHRHAILSAVFIPASARCVVGWTTSEGAPPYYAVAVRGAA